MTRIKYLINRYESKRSYIEDLLQSERKGLQATLQGGDLNVVSQYAVRIEKYEVQLKEIDEFIQEIKFLQEDEESEE